jgi:flagellin
MHENALTTAIERLASGKRINQAKDGPVDNYHTKKASNEILRTEKARQNSTDGASLLQVAEGTCNEVQSILHRIRELAIQSANDTVTSTERKYLDIEANGLLKEINRIVASTTFNTKQIFGNRGDSFSDEERNLGFPYEPNTNGPRRDPRDPYDPNHPDVKVWTPFTAHNKDGEATRAGVLHVGSGAGKIDEVKVSLPEISYTSLGLQTLSITYQNGAARAIDDLDYAMNSISTIRSYMGSLVNRMDLRTEYSDDRTLALTDYVNRISDADFAKESTEMLSAQIKQQAATSVLAQSNSRLNVVLEMLAK